MALYTELFTLSSNVTLLQRVAVAIAVSIDTIKTEAENTPFRQERIRWAYRASQSPAGEANRLIWLVLAANKDLTSAQITAATDAQLQTACDAVINTLARGF